MIDHLPSRGCGVCETCGHQRADEYETSTVFFFSFFGSRRRRRDKQIFFCLKLSTNTNDANRMVVDMAEECVCSNLTHTKRCTHTVRGEAGHSLGLLVYDVTGCVGEIYAYSFAFTEFVFFCKSYFKQNEPRHGESESTSDVVLT